MNHIRPFRGITPNEAVVGALGDVVCPPYDIISPAEQEALYERSPYNIVRLELGREEPGDDVRDNRYTRAATTMSEWMAAGALLREDEPALYLYDQQFSLDGKAATRRGVLAALRLTPWSEGIVLPHEETMSKPKEDRLRLMRATECNLSPLFLLFEDDGGEARREMARLASARPDAEADTGDGQLHRIWVVRGEVAGGLLAALRGAQLFMADGHHRYETALAYRDERRAGDDDPAEDAAYNFAMVLLVDAADPGLVVLPTHRMVRGIEPDRLEEMKARLGESFQVEGVDVAGQGPEGTARALLAAMEEAGESAPAIGLYEREGGARLLRLRRPERAAGGPAQLLDVDVLHGSIVEPLLGIGPEALKAGDRVVYTRDAAEAVQAVDRGEFQAAFLLNPTKVNQVLATARAGGKMPQKSTYFYPKPATGLVMNWLSGEIE
jgi:uncharacterized protein (DUF1015 family)